MNNVKKIIYSVIVPAYNEEKYLAKTLDGIIKAMEETNGLGQSGEIIVVDNNSTDNTAKIAKTYGVKVLFEPYNQISKARNKGAAAAHGEYLIFIDADTLICPDLLQRVITSMEEEDIYAGGAIVKFDADIPLWANMFTRLWNRIAMVNKWAPGAFLFCRRDAFEDVGGFNETIYASEEIWLCVKLRRWAKKNKREFLFINDIPVITSSRKFDWFSSCSLLFYLFLPVITPFGIFSKKLCSLWYKRPDRKN